MPQVDALIQLYEITDGGIPTPLRFCNYTESDGSTVQLGGVSYLPYPIQSNNGWERSLDGALPRPTIILSNIFSDISALIQTWGGINAKLIRKTIPIKNLDGGTSPNPAGVLKEEVYYVARFSWNNQQAVIHLRSPLDIENLRLPRRTVGSLLD